MGSRRPVGDVATEDESFARTSGTFTGWLVIAVAVCVAVLAFFDGRDGFGLAAVAAALLASVFSWLTVLRPRVLLQQGHVVLRQSLSTTRIPLVAVEEVTVRHVLEVRAGGQRFRSAAVGHPRRRLMREAAQTHRDGEEVTAPRLGEVHYADHVQAKVRRAALDARARQHGGGDARVTRSMDPVPVAVLVVVVAVAATVLL